MNTYNQLYQFNESGLDAFQKVFKGELAESMIDPCDQLLVSTVEGTGSIAVKNCETAKEMAQIVLDSLCDVKVSNHVSNAGLWTWLTFVFRDVLFRRDSRGLLIAGETRRWLPSKPSDYRDAARHLVRMPVFLLDQFGDDADHMLCGPPNEVPKIRYELSRSQGMLNVVFQSVARMLYYDDEFNKLKSGTAGIGSPGTAYRLAQVFKQFDVTYEIEDMEPDEFMDILPAEFNRFKPSNDGKESVIRRIVNKHKP